MSLRCRATLPVAASVLCVALAALLAANGIPAPAAAARIPTPRGYVCSRSPGPIVVDGKLEAAWADVPWTDDFVDIEGDVKPKPKYRTRVKMLWDDEALYIAAELEEPHVGALLTKHDSYIFHEDNDFEVFLDPDGDGHLYGELEMNALNTTWDLLLTKPYRDGGRAIDAWEIDGLKTAVQVDGTINDARDVDRGWTIEIAWPWKGLNQISSAKMPPRDGDYWRINFSRVQLVREFRDGRYRRTPNTGEENWVWSPQGAVNMHLPDRWGELLFSTSPAGTVPFRPDPSRTVRRALHSVFDAQAAYRRAHGRWATGLDELGIKGPFADSLSLPRLETTSTRYEVFIDRKTPAGAVERWRLESDSRVWKE